jgi:hypothetical protein
MNYTMDRHKFKEGKYIIALYEHEECILIAYLHKSRLFIETPSFSIIEFVVL